MQQMLCFIQNQFADFFQCSELEEKCPNQDDNAHLMLNKWLVSFELWGKKELKQ